MISDDELPIYRDAFNMMCGDKIGSGVYRDVFQCKLRPDLVVKVERETNYRDFTNVREMRFWCDNQDYAAIAKWLAPCEFLSPDGRILLQKKAAIVSEGDLQNLPTQLPAFLTDTKFGNFGWINGKLVCVDYASVISTCSTRLRKADWW